MLLLGGLTPAIADESVPLAVDLPPRWERIQKGSLTYLFPPDFGRRNLLIAISSESSPQKDFRSWFEEKIGRFLKTTRVLQMKDTTPLDSAGPSSGLRKLVVVDETDPVKKNIVFIGLHSENHLAILAVMYRDVESYGFYAGDLAQIIDAIRLPNIQKENINRRRNSIVQERIRQERQEEAAEEAAAEARTEAARRNRQNDISSQQRIEQQRFDRQMDEQRQEQRREDVQEGRIESGPFYKP
jgi:hypothetical protein